MRGLEHLRRLGAHRTTHRMIRTDMHSTTSHASLSQGARRSHRHPTSQDWASPYAARNATSSHTQPPARHRRASRCYTCATIPPQAALGATRLSTGRTRLGMTSTRASRSTRDNRHASRATIEDSPEAARLAQLSQPLSTPPQLSSPLAVLSTHNHRERDSGSLLTPVLCIATQGRPSPPFEYAASAERHLRPYATLPRVPTSSACATSSAWSGTLRSTDCH